MDTSPQTIIANEPNLLASVRELYSRFPEARDLEPWELQHVLWSLRYCGDLIPEGEVAAAQRVFVEASWNAVKHSGTRNLWLETRRVDSVVIVRIRDDGRGFDTSDPPPGLGLRYMRRPPGRSGPSWTLSPPSAAVPPFSSTSTKSEHPFRRLRSAIRAAASRSMSFYQAMGAINACPPHHP
jgi:hypothetical protein